MAHFHYFQVALAVGVLLQGCFFVVAWDVGPSGPIAFSVGPSGPVALDVGPSGPVALDVGPSGPVDPPQTDDELLAYLQKLISSRQPPKHHLAGYPTFDCNVFGEVAWYCLSSDEKVVRDFVCVKRDGSDGDLKCKSFGIAPTYLCTKEDEHGKRLCQPLTILQPTRRYPNYGCQVKKGTMNFHCESLSEKKEKKEKEIKKEEGKK